MALIVKPFDFVAFLPEVVWYLTESGQDMWCRKPYGFLFTSSEAAERFAQEMGSRHELVPIGVGRGDLMSPTALDGVRGLGVTRLFLDPQIDPTTGDVVGQILRLEAQVATA
jgi:hypothetical protein